MQEKKHGAVFLTEVNTLIEGWVKIERDGDCVLVDEDRYPNLENSCSCFIEDILVEHPYEFRYPEEFKSHLLFSAN